MSNRQARREQTRRSRGDRNRPGPTRRNAPGPARGGGGPRDFLSGPFLLIAGGLLAVIIIAIGAFAAFSSGNDNEGAAQSLVEAKANFPFDLASGYEVGDPDAPLTITAYEDFRCPHCLNYTANNEPEIIENYVKTGQVRLIFQNFAVLGPESVNAGRGAECAAEQDLFWEMHHELFLEHAREGQSMDYSDGAVRNMAETAGLDLDAFDTCYASDATLNAVQDQSSTARSFGLTGTPGFLFNGVPFTGAPSNFEGWQQVIDAELESLAGEDGANGDGGNGDDANGDDGNGEDAEATATP